MAHSYVLILLMLSAAALAGPKDSKKPKTNSASKHVANVCDGAWDIQTAGALADAWKQSQDAANAILTRFFGARQFLQDGIATSIADDFMWLNGPPGGGKTSLPRRLFQAQLNAIGDEDKRVFLLQFHKLMSEGVIIGSPKLKEMLDNGRQVIETSTSLVGDRFIFAILDEAEKANAATLVTLLQVLNERKAFHGSTVVQAMLRSGVITSNKTLAEFIRASGDRPTFEALLDRMGVKRHVPNQYGSVVELIDMYNSVQTSKSLDGLKMPIQDLKVLLKRVQISPIIEKVADLIVSMDGVFTQKADKSLEDIRNRVSNIEFFPANQFTNRSAAKILTMMKASFLAKQLLDGVPIDKLNLTMGDQDLIHLATPALYGGPGRIRLKQFEIKDVQVLDKLKTPINAAVAWSPFESAIYITDTDYFREYQLNVIDGKITPSIDFTLAGLSLSDKTAKEIADEIEKFAKSKNSDLKRPQFEVDGMIGRLINKASVSDAQKQELHSILEDWSIFVQLANTEITGAIQTIDAKAMVVELRKLKEEIENDNQTSTELLVKTFQNKNLAEEKKLKIYYEVTQKTMRNLNEVYLEMDHVIEAGIVGPFAGRHQLLFGGPGGAKTSISRSVLNSLINWENITRGHFPDEMKIFAEKLSSKLIKEDREKAELFFLQLHKLVPEGVIVGFPKLQKQLDTGKVEFDLSTSLAHTKFIHAILDEVEKAHPGFLTILLSVLEEGEIFSGAEVFKTALRSAVLTSNKTPSEFLDAFDEDRPTGEAILDRTLDKVWVANKFSDKKLLIRFLFQIDSGLFPDLNVPLPLETLKPLAQKVKMQDFMKYVMGEVFDSFNGKRLKVEQDTRLIHQQAPDEYPDYFVKASSGSKRNFLALMDQLKYLFIIDQLNSGVAYDNLSFDFQLKDMPVFLKGLGYWTPSVVTYEYDIDGFLAFKVQKSVLDDFRNSPTVSARWRYTIDMLSKEADDYKDTLNETIRGFLIQYRETIAKFPNLFPSLIGPKKKVP